MNSIMIAIVNSLVTDRCGYNLTYALSMFHEGDFDLHGVDHEAGSHFTAKHKQTGVIVKVASRNFFGCSVELLEDPNNIIIKDVA